MPAYYFQFQKGGQTFPYGPEIADTEAEATARAQRVATGNNATIVNVSTSPTFEAPTPAPITEPIEQPQYKAYQGDRGVWYVRTPEKTAMGGYSTEEEARKVEAEENAKIFPQLDAVGTDLENQLARLLQDLIARGYQVNPAVTIGPAEIAEFAKIAEAEISPYYATQLKIAREGFLRAQGYNMEDVELLERQLTQKYPLQLRQLGEAAAERGLALSGQRQLGEQQLAEDVGQQLAQARTLAQRQATGAASQFAQQWGTLALPTTPTIPQYRALTGEPTIEKARELPLYSLDESIYRDLTGEQTYAQRAALRARKAELTGLTRELGGIEAVRQLL